MATLTYGYAESTAVVGPLASQSEPHSYDLCTGHARRLTAPRGWQVVRFEGELGAPQHPNDDLSVLAEAVREVGRTDRPGPAAPVTQSGRRGHLRMLPGSAEN